MSARGTALRTLRIGTMAAVALAAALVAAMALAPRAEAFVYFDDRGNFDLATNDGSDVQQDLIVPAITGFGSGGCVCPVAYNGYLYWADPERSFMISRARVDGTDVNYNFINPGVSSLTGLAVTGAGIFWGDFGPSPTGRIGRADLDGGNVNPDFIVGGPSYSVGLGLTANESHIYWSGQSLGPGPLTVTVGRANIDGTGVDHTVVELNDMGTHPRIGDLALSSTHVYWADQGGGPGDMGRATLDGGDVNTTFVPNGGADTGEISIEGDYLYFAPQDADGVGRMNLDGTNINPLLIPSPTDDRVNFFAVDGLTVSADPECDAAIKALKKAKKKLKKAKTPAAKAKAKKKVKRAKKKKKEACGG